MDVSAMTTDISRPASPRPVQEFCQDYVNHKYNRIHFSFFLQTARMAKISLNMVPADATVFVPDDALIWSCRIDGQQVIFDYSDHYYRDWRSRWPDLPYFKFQKTSGSAQDVWPLGPPMVGGKRRGVEISTLQRYYTIRRQFRFDPKDLITCKQQPNGAATERRNQVHSMLRKEFQNIDVNSNSHQETFWRVHESCLASVCVPGANNNMVDRGHMELLGLGVCTVSPRLDTLFPGHRVLEPGVHYLQCADDYSDLCSILRDLTANPQQAKQVGLNARKFFDKTYIPVHYWAWIMSQLERYHAT